MEIVLDLSEDEAHKLLEYTRITHKQLALFIGDGPKMLDRAVTYLGQSLVRALLGAAIERGKPCT